MKQNMAIRQPSPFLFITIKHRLVHVMRSIAIISQEPTE